MNKPVYHAGEPARGVVYAYSDDIAGMKREIVRLTTIIARARIALAKDSLAPSERIADADAMLSSLSSLMSNSETKP